MIDVAEKLDCYLVGGSVRDELLSIKNHDRDWVVIGSTESELEALRFQRVGRDFPVFLHPKTKEEYALARRERKQGHGYRGFVVDAAPTVTLEEDLARRDLTVNAMAKSASGEIIDPYNGRADLEAGILRHVSDAFAEDPLRVLRVARFAARYHARGFRIAPETMALMSKLVADGEVACLVSERVYTETSRALDEDHPSVYFETLRSCGGLAVLFPEIDALFGVPQPAAHHPEIDSGVHTMLAIDYAASAGVDNRVRFAVLVHDLGKATTPKEILPSHFGHEARGVPLIEALCDRLRVPNDYRRLATAVARHHLNCHRIRELSPKTILKLLKDLGAFGNNSMLGEFLLACKCDARGRKDRAEAPYPQEQYLASISERVAEIRADDVRATTSGELTGPALGLAIHRARLDTIKSCISET